MRRPQSLRFTGQRPWLLLAIALATLLLLTLLTAPNNPQNRGSTYGRTPDGYGAWYAYMQGQSIPINRWQRPFNGLAAQTKNQGQQTLLRVNSPPENGNITSLELDWVKQGNRLVLLGVQVPVTSAPFRSAPNGVQIATTRRQTDLSDGYRPMLSDNFGAAVWRETFGEGEVVYASTPYLAANAYQNAPENFEFVAQLVAAENYTVWVDEYIHGHRDANIIAEEVGQSWEGYLARTSLMPALIQAVVVLLVLVWASNIPWGQPQPLVSPTVDNSNAYMQALAGALRQARSSDFVVKTVGRAEQLQLQQALGLGRVEVSAATLLTAWHEQTGRPTAELEQAMQPYWRQQRLTDAELTRWVQQLQALRQYLPR